MAVTLKLGVSRGHWVKAMADLPFGDFVATRVGAGLREMQSPTASAWTPPSSVRTKKMPPPRRSGKKRWDLHSLFRVIESARSHRQRLVLSFEEAITGSSLAGEPTWQTSIAIPIACKKWPAILAVLLNERDAKVALRKLKGEWKEAFIDIGRWVIRERWLKGAAAIVIYADTMPYGLPPSMPIAYLCRDDLPEKIIMLDDIIRAAEMRYGMTIVFSDRETVDNVYIAYASEPYIDHWNARETTGESGAQSSKEEAAMIALARPQGLLLYGSLIGLVLAVIFSGFDARGSPYLFLASCVVFIYSLASTSMSK